MSLQLTLDLRQRLVDIHRVGGALIVFFQTVFCFVEPVVCRILVLAGIETLDQCECQTCPLAVWQLCDLVLDAVYRGFHADHVRTVVRGSQRAIQHFLRGHVVRP